MASDEKPSTHAVKLRGLPYEVSKAQIITFLKDVEIVGDEGGIHLMISNIDGKMTGEAYIQVATEEDVQNAMKCDRQNIDRRYIEVFEMETKTEFADAMERQKSIQLDHETIVRLRGLPYDVKYDDIKTFFEGIQIKSSKNKKLDIKFLTDHSGSKTGEAFVYFENPEETKKALDKNREKIGKRYIEIFRATPLEVEREVNKTGFPKTGLYLDKSGVYRGGGSNRAMRDRPYPMNDGPGMRGGGFRNGGNFGGNNNWGGGNDNNWGGNGNNFDNGNGNGYGRNDNFGGFNNFCNDGPNFGGSMDGPMGGPNFNNFNNFDNGCDSNSFNNDDDGAFRIHIRGLPFVSDEVDIREFFAPLKPIEVEIIYDERRRHAGEANVFFSTIEEIDEAMKKHKEMMGSRWIELFFKGFVTGPNNCNGPASMGSGFGRNNNMRNNRF